MQATRSGSLVNARNKLRKYSECKENIRGNLVNARNTIREFSECLEHIGGWEGLSECKEKKQRTECPHIFL